MTKTQKKAQAYIIDCIDSEAYEVKTSTDKEKIQFLFDTFRNEYGWYIERVGVNEALKEWYMGLPSVFNMAFTNYDILQLAKKWGTLAENATEKQEDKILSNYWNLLASNTIQLFNKHKVVIK
jgi:hypothetical protein